MKKKNQLPTRDTKLKNTNDSPKCTNYIEASMAIHNGREDCDFGNATDFLPKIKDRSPFQNNSAPEGSKEVKIKLINTLKSKYRDAIIKEYTAKVQSNIQSKAKIEHQMSGYPGNFEEYCEMCAKEELMSQYRNYRYGGYMHVVILSIIREYKKQVKTIVHNKRDR